MSKGNITTKQVIHENNFIHAARSIGVHTRGAGQTSYFPTRNQAGSFTKLTICHSVCYLFV